MRVRLGELDRRRRQAVVSCGAGFGEFQAIDLGGAKRTPIDAIATLSLS